MKKAFFLFAVLLQTIIVMAQNPAKQQMPQHQSILNGLPAGFNNTALSAQKANRPGIIISSNEELPGTDKVPGPPGPNAPVRIIFSQSK